MFDHEICPCLVAIRLQLFIAPTWLLLAIIFGILKRAIATLFYIEWAVLIHVICSHEFSHPWRCVSQWKKTFSMIKWFKPWKVFSRVSLLLPSMLLQKFIKKLHIFIAKKSQWLMINIQSEKYYFFLKANFFCFLFFLGVSKRSLNEFTHCKSTVSS